MAIGLFPVRRCIAFGIGSALLLAGSILLMPGTNQTVSAAPLCTVDFSLPSGNTAELRPGETALFSYSAVITGTEVHAIDLQIFGGSGSEMAVDIQPQSASPEVTPSSSPQRHPVSGRISASAPSSAEPGVYTVGGLGAVATCTTRERDGSQTTTMGRDLAEDISITVLAPVEPSPTPRPSPTNTPETPPTATPVPLPAICEPGLTLVGDSVLEASPGSQVTVPFEASVVVRRVSRADLRVVSGYQGPLAVAVEPAESSFSFDPLPVDTVLRTVSGMVSVVVPAGQPPGSYVIIGDLVANAVCQGVDQTGASTSLTASSVALSITVRLAASTATPEPSATNTAPPSPSATARQTSTATPTPTLSPTSTATASASPTRSAVPTGTGVPTVTPSQSPTVGTTPTQTPTALVTPASTPTVLSTVTRIGETPVIEGSGEVDPSPTGTVPSAVILAVEDTTVVAAALADSGSTTLDWTENREIFASARESRSYGELILGAVSALLIAGGAYGAWRSRGGSSRSV